MEELNFRVVLLFLILYNVIKGDEKMFEKHFNRSYETHDFPYFVPEKELDYNVDYAKRIVDEKWVYYRWREDVERGGWKRNEETAEKITAHGGLNL